MLIIEVGQPIPPAGSITGASLMTVAQMLRSNTNMNPSNNADNNNSISNSANRGNNGRSADAGGSRIASGNTQPGPVSRLPTPTPAADTTSLANLPRGIRGLDYPAFDVSSEGVYNEDSQAVSRFLAPLQRVFERVYGQNENSNSGTLGTTAEGRNLHPTCRHQADLPLPLALPLPQRQTLQMGTPRMRLLQMNSNRTHQQSPEISFLPSTMSMGDPAIQTKTTVALYCYMSQA